MMKTLVRTNTTPNNKNNRPGRPSSYNETIPVRALKLLKRHALIDEDLAVAFGVHPDTIDEWRRRHPEFAAALREGKLLGDMKVERALFARAVGYEYTETETNEKRDVDSGETTQCTVKTLHKRMAPDVGAQIFWLKNRRPDKWRDIQRTELTVKGLNDLAELFDLDSLTQEEKDMVRSIGLKRLATIRGISNN